MSGRRFVLEEQDAVGRRELVEADSLEGLADECSGLGGDPWARYYAVVMNGYSKEEIFSGDTPGEVEEHIREKASR